MGRACDWSRFCTAWAAFSAPAPSCAAATADAGASSAGVSSLTGAGATSSIGASVVGASSAMVFDGALHEKVKRF